MNRPVTACDECRELIGGYVLDALEPGEMAVVRRHLESCPRCAREHAELAAIPALLEVAGSADAVPERPPPRLEYAVLDRFAREHRGAGVAASDGDRERPSLLDRLRERWRRPSWGIAAAVLASLAGAAILATGLAIRDDGGGSSAPQAQDQPSFRSQLTAAAAPSGATGHATLSVKNPNTAVHLTVRGLRPKPGHSYTYEVWCVGKQGWRVSAGTFRVDRDGNADVQLTTAADPRKYDTLSVEAKKPGSAPAAHGTRVLVGKVRS